MEDEIFFIYSGLTNIETEYENNLNNYIREYFCKNYVTNIVKSARILSLSYKKNIVVKRVFILILTVGVCACSCKGTGEKKNKSVDLQKNLEEKYIRNQEDIEPIHLKLTDGKGSKQLHKNENQIIYVDFESVGYKKLYAKISSSDQHANIRISQIILPDGRMDGPFGEDITYHLPMDGMYTISIHENMMAGDPWSGDFLVEVALQ